MNLQQLLHILAFANSLRSAQAIPAVELTSISLVPRQDNKPAWCYGVESAIEVVKALPQQYKAEVLFVGLSGGLSGHAAYSVCRAYNPADTAVARCQHAGIAVGELVGLIGIGVIANRELPIKGEQATEKRHEALRSRFEQYLHARGSEFEAIEVSRDVRRSGTESGKITVRGLRDEHGNTHDHEIGIGEDGHSGIARLSFPNQSKRGNGAGMKMSYEFFHVLSGSNADTDGIEALGYNVGQDWRTRMEKNQGWSDYIAALQFGPDYKMSIHVVPEDSSSWSDSYDSPTVCGKVNI
ncbi:hypothetical protein F4778DRAFT_710085 [Xylariomycetidae sp. FL2044]|nr:hypothetical protein F4778DRAFT_710085 [Xylariomycetidae sp. FL2044]